VQVRNIESIVSLAVAAGILGVNLTLQCHQSGIYCSSWKRELRPRSMTENYFLSVVFECLIFQPEYGICHQKCFKSPEQFCLSPASTGVKWSAL